MRQRREAFVCICRVRALVVLYFVYLALIGFVVLCRVYDDAYDDAQGSIKRSRASSLSALVF